MAKSKRVELLRTLTCISLFTLSTIINLKSFFYYVNDLEAVIPYDAAANKESEVIVVFVGKFV